MGVAAVPDTFDPIPPALRDAVLAWYDAAGRALPFRGTRDPYAILVSELMAQQTQVARAAEAWVGWMERFPVIEALADAPLADVLRAWAGLGYNRRAVHLHRAARAIVRDHGGRVPDTVAGLLELPGVGPYTARAVAAIAFGHRVGAVDTNVRRVIGRVVGGMDEAIPASALQVIADAAVPRERAGDWTHAVMDLGARLCIPRRPRCGACPAAPWCRLAAASTATAHAAGRAAPTTGSAATAAAPAGPAGAVRAERRPGARTRSLDRSRPGDPRSRAVRVTRPAASTGSPARVRRPEPAFQATARWLRGRIVARLRDAPDGAWLTFDDPIGQHGQPAVRAALEGLARDGLVELDGPERARIATVAPG
jgi:A/G-specific adenine glycosylase